MRSGGRGHKSTVLKMSTNIYGFWVGKIPTEKYVNILPLVGLSIFLELIATVLFLYNLIYSLCDLRDCSDAVCLCAGHAADGLQVQLPRSVSLQPLKHQTGGCGHPRVGEPPHAAESLTPLRQLSKNKYLASGRQVDITRGRQL